MKALQESVFYRNNRDKLQRFLRTVELRVMPDVRPRLERFLRVVSWNIEKGKHYDGVIHTFTTHPVLEHADLIFLNEVDMGMNRSANVHVARELAKALKMNYLFAPAHFELTKGTKEELDLPGENVMALQGNCILSRYALLNPRLIDLPVCFEPYEYPEKRYGRRIAILSEVALPEKHLAAACTHLEVRNTPSCRAKQMATLMEALEPDRNGLPALVGGDLNCNTFRRGTRWRSYSGFLRILLSDTRRLKQKLLTPFSSGETLFEILRRYGFSFQEFNDTQPTSYASLEGIEDALKLPPALRDLALAKLKDHDYRLDLKLDWFAGRGIVPLGHRERFDPASGVHSLPPQTIKGLRFQDQDIADHDPIVLDVGI